jgi:hypothetical protein
MRPFASRGIGVWICTAIAAIAVLPIVPAPTLSQTCEDDSILYAAFSTAGFVSFLRTNRPESV